MKTQVWQKVGIRFLVKLNKGSEPWICIDWENFDLSTSGYYIFTCDFIQLKALNN